MFPAIDEFSYARENAPGAVIAKKGRILLNEGRERVKLLVTNNGDRPIQVRYVMLITPLLINEPATDWLPLPFR